MFHNFFNPAQDVYTSKSHMDNMIDLIKNAERCTIVPDNDQDAECASRQIEFAKELYGLACEFESTSMFYIRAKLNLGYRMSWLASEYFGKEEVPEIKGTKSAEIAKILIRKNFESFTKIEFSSAQKKLSSIVGRIIGFDSISQITINIHKLIRKIDDRILNFERSSMASSRLKK